ncbi:hypothetical protein TYRP_014506 [Tyrophagus putrescentiae]|nr:hypothetical protein TYRP_014506 [Tyrophagus putrescentiae]
MRKQVRGVFFADNLCLVTLLVVMVIFQVASTSSNFPPNKDSRQNKVYFGLLKDIDASKDKKSSLLEEEGMRFKKGSGGSSLLDEEGMRFKKGELLDDEGMRFKKGSSSLLDEEGMRFKKGSSLLNDEGMRFKKGSSLLNEEGMRFKKGASSLLNDEGMRFRRNGGSGGGSSNLMNRNAIIRKSVLEGEGLRFKKDGSSLLDEEGMRFKKGSASSLLDEEGMRFKKGGSSLLNDEGMRFRRKSESNLTGPQERLEEVDKSKRYFPGHLLNFYPFNIDFTNSYERRSDRSGNRDILEGEGMRF